MGRASAAAVEAAFRSERAAVLAALIGQLGDFGLAEDALQDAFAAAVVAWERDGVPERPGAWITTAARRRAIDRLRRDRTLADRVARLRLLAERDAAARRHEPEPEPSAIADDRLRLVFICCHPALAPEARVALTLRSLGGLSTAEIARRSWSRRRRWRRGWYAPSARWRPRGSPTGCPPTRSCRTAWPECWRSCT